MVNKLIILLAECLKGLSIDSKFEHRTNVNVTLRFWWIDHNLKGVLVMWRAIPCAEPAVAMNVEELKAGSRMPPKSLRPCAGDAYLLFQVMS